LIGLAIAAFLCSTISVRAADDRAALDAWLRAQTNYQTWTAEFTQTRALKTLAQPLTAQGKVFFSAPNLFRWELGEPAQTIAVRQADQMLVIYPRLKRAERYPLAGVSAGPMKDAMALIEAGFPRSAADMEAHFKILSIGTTNGVCSVALQPKAASARRMMPQIQIAFGISDNSLRSTELTFADGSTMRNDFKNPQFNPKLEETVFKPELGPEIKVTEPAGKK
jgi:outer membrane lipoprotein-sorting protein